MSSLMSLFSDRTFWMLNDHFKKFCQDAEICLLEHSCGNIRSFSLCFFFLFFSTYEGRFR